MKNKRVKTIVMALGLVVMSMGALLLSTSPAQAEYGYMASCECDTDVDGCWHDGNSEKCGRGDCSGGRCKPKNGDSDGDGKTIFTLF